MKRWKFLPALLLLVVLLGLLAAPAGAVSGSDLCYRYTPQMTDNTFRYLDEIYIQKYPQAALRFEEGTAQDRQDLAHLADIITQGCATDREKASAIALWIKRNIEYSEGSSIFYAADVFYARKGNCASYAQLMQALLRLEGIPAVWGDGFAMDTQTVTVEQMHNSWAGHAWCFAYVDGQWALYDPLWEGGTAVTDRDYIARNYFLDTVDQIVPAYDLQNLPPLRDERQAYVYADGRFWALENGAIITKPGVGAGSVTINLTGAYHFSRCGYVVDDPAGSDGYDYPEHPDRKKDMVVGELYRNGWLTYGTLNLSYLYENGVAAHGVLKEFNGVEYFLSFDCAMHLLLSKNDYFIESGYICIEPGFSGMVFEPYWYPQYKDDEEYEIIWTSDDTSVATVDQNGFVTSTGKAGVAVIELSLRWKGGAGIQAREGLVLSFEENDRVADFNDYQPHECSYQTQVVPPTCVSGGYTVHTCSCGNSYQDNETEALGHSYGPWQIIQEATQEQDGIQMRKCIRCDNEETSLISYVPPEHVCDYKVVQVVEPDCEHEGYTVSECSCGRTRYSDQTPSLGGHRFGPWEVVEPPVAEHDGLQIRECIQCGQLEAEPIPAGTELPSQPTEPNGQDHTCQWVAVEVVPAWCDEDGFTVYACTVCGNEKLDDFTPAGHSYGPWEVLQEPDEYNTGFRVRFCEFCGEAQEQELPAGSGGQMPPDPTDPPRPTYPVTPDPTDPSRPTDPSQPTNPAPNLPIDPEGVWIQAEGDSDVSVLFPGADPEQLAGVTVQVQVVEDVQQVQEQLEAQMGPVARVYLADITLMAGGHHIQPDGIVVVEMPIPDPSWTQGQIAVYHISESGEVTGLQADLSEDGTRVLFVVEHFSYYALVQHAESTDPAEPTEPTTPSTPEVPGTPKTEILPWILVGVLLVVIAVGTVVVILLIKKRK